MEGKKIVIPIHCNDEYEQLDKARKLEKILVALGHKVSLVNLDGSNDPLVIQTYIDQLKPELLMTIDGSGFDLNLLGDDLYYNSLCVPAMHFLTKDIKCFDEILNKRMNFNMSFYVEDIESKEYVEKNFRRVPRVVAYAGMFEKGNIKEYISSKEMMNQVMSLPKVFIDLFSNSVQVLDENRRLTKEEVLDIYLNKISMEASEEEKMELMMFVELAITYLNIAEFEEQAGFLGNEIQELM